MRRILTLIILVASFLCLLAEWSLGAVFPVSNATELQFALSLSEMNGQDDIIKAAQGTYYGNFSYDSSEGYSITLLGGYTSDFSGRVINPSNTVLDGGGSDTVLYIYNHDNGGNIFIEGFTIRNGYGGVYAYTWSSSGPGGDVTVTNNIISDNISASQGGGVYASSAGSSTTAGAITITNNTITGNGYTWRGGGLYVNSTAGSSTAGTIAIASNIITGNYVVSYPIEKSGGGVFAQSYSSSGTAAAITLTNNIITGNTTDDRGGGVYVSSQTSSGTPGTITLTNNTISGNTANDEGGGGTYLFMLENSYINIYNNIIWGNTAPTGGDIYIQYSSGTANGYNNDYSVMYGGWTYSVNNINENPYFVGIGDYHLQGDSPCIDKGTNSAPEIPDTDYEGNIRIFDGDNDSTATVDIGADEFIDAQDDLIGTWDGQGVYYRNSNDGTWVKMATPADLIAAGDLDGDGIDDLIGIWSGQGGVWVKYSSTASWSKLSSTARDIASGDMNGDGTDDLLGTWDGQGVYYRDSDTGTWVKMASPADLIATGDLDGDGTDDLIGIWAGQGGVWVKYSSTGGWSKLSSTARDIASGDMNGDGTDDLLGTWDGQGVYYRDSDTGTWVKMASPADLIAAGDLDGDGTDDLIGIWAGQGGVWVKYSSTGGWEKLSSAARDMAAGKMKGWGGSGGTAGFIKLLAPIGGFAEGPGNIDNYQDLSSEGPRGWNFVFQTEKNLVPQEEESINMMKIPGPGEPGFKCIEQKNLLPQKRLSEKKRKKK